MEKLSSKCDAAAGYDKRYYAREIKRSVEKSGLSVYLSKIKAFSL